MSLDYKSISIRIAANHLVFRHHQLSAVVDEPYKNKIGEVFKVLEAHGKKTRFPHVVVFPEMSGSEFLESVALEWVGKHGGLVVCGTRFDDKKQRVVSGLALNNSVIYVEKQKPSPYDNAAEGITVLPGRPVNSIITLPVPYPNNELRYVRVKVMICYDLRFPHLFMMGGGNIFLDQDGYQLVIVPMFDVAYKEPFDLARGYARRYSLRMLLLNNPFQYPDNANSTISRVVNRFFHEFGKRLNFLKPYTSLESAFFGPTNKSDAAELAKKRRGLIHQFIDSIVWRKTSEGIVVGDYEVGVAETAGHDNGFDTGFFYRNIESIELG